MKPPFAPAALCHAKRFGFLSAIAAVVAVNATGATNILTNPGFESGSLSGWSTFGPNNYIQTSVPHSGSRYCKVYGQFNGAYNYTGIYQDNPSTPGVIYSADGWAYSLSSDGGGIHGQDMIWLEVSFRDAAYNTLALYRSDVVTGDNIANYGGLDGWFDLQITNQCSFTNGPALILSPGATTNTVTDLMAPAGTAYVRYQIVFAQGPDNANGSMYFDDLALNQTGGTVTVPPATQWNIVWSDEFNGTTIDPNHWTFDIGNGSGGWGNNELEYYTSRPQNAYVSNGSLHIVAIKESYSGLNYTSAKLKTLGHFSKKYGRFEFRVRLPQGKGYWPALWMMPQNSVYGGWAASGEIDIMENKGGIPTTVSGTIHYGGAYPANTHSSGPSYNFTGGDSVTNFHTYLLEWAPNAISWSVDGNLYQSQTSWNSTGGPYPAPFNQLFYLIMNLAVGGNFDGNPDDTTIFPAQMQVDYVRVYDQTAPLALSVATQPDGSMILNWPTNIVCHLQALTNSAGLSGGANWSDVVGATNHFAVFSDPNQSAVFYRLESP
jgi:beta-glucanase (GH16 family)